MVYCKKDVTPVCHIFRALAIDIYHPRFAIAVQILPHDKDHLYGIINMIEADA